MSDNAVTYVEDFFTDMDKHLFSEGNHFQLYEKLGSHIMAVGGESGAHFAVWAPNAREVSVIADVNNWRPGAHKLHPSNTGIWQGFIPGIGHGDLYKYHIISNHNNYAVDKADPFAFHWEVAPKTASTVWDLGYEWGDAEWRKSMAVRNSLDSPMAVYEVHPGSWRRNPDDEHRLLSYRELAHELAAYVKDMGFTHVELMPVMEHPFYGSWGYQVLGFFAPSSRYGAPQDFMYFVDYMHQNGIGVILDWVPSHFPSDEHGLVYFDGTHLYEHRDPRKGFHPEWKSYIFNFGRNEVRNFLISSGRFWLERYHADGLRVDAVASMLYLDYAREEGEWIPNEYGGNENLDAIHFLRRFNEIVYERNPNVQIMAEESTAWPMVTRPTSVGGLGFGLKWNMGWMHDTLNYFSQDPIHRKYHHNSLTFGLWYAFFENFILPLSHDEVVHGKGSLLGKMPGDDWQKFANLRLLYGFMWTHPGKKLLFMGADIPQWREWNHDASLDWHLLQYAPHQGVNRWLGELNALYRANPALYRRDFTADGFEWIDFQDWEGSIISFLRKGDSPGDDILVICNFTPVPRTSYTIGVPESGYWKELLNSDAAEYGGSGMGNLGGVQSGDVPSHGKPHSLTLTLPPLGICIFKKEE